MKIKIFITFLFLLMTASQVGAAQKKKGVIDEMSGQGYGMAGCGLGSILFGEREGAVQIFASTTNHTYSNNTFGVTSGTSNCAPEYDNDRAAEIFIETNRIALQNDIARGSGETLASFYRLTDCSQQSEVNQVLHSNYEKIFSAGSNDAQVLETIRQTIRANQKTAQACTHLG